MQKLAFLIFGWLLPAIYAFALPNNITEPFEGSGATNINLSLDPYCLPERSMGNRNEAMSCLNFLLLRNEQWCELTSQRSAEFCFSGKTRITGVTETSVAVKSRCVEVAQAVAWVIENCSNGTKVGGVQAATGNKNLRVVVEGR